MKWRHARDVHGVDGLALARPLSVQMHPVILAAMEACDRIVSDPSEFPELQFKELSRKRRLERLTSIALTLKALFYRADILSCRVGVRIEDRPKYLQGLSVAALASLTWTGLEHAGPADKRGRRGRRVERACGDINRARYHTCKEDKLGRLRSPQPIEREELPSGGWKYKGLPSVRHISPLLLRRLGVALKWELAQKEKRRELEAAAAAAAKERETATQAELRRRLIPPEPKWTPDEEAAAIADLRRGHADWTPEFIRDFARRLLALRRRGPGPPE